MIPTFISTFKINGKLKLSKMKHESLKILDENKKFEKIKLWKMLIKIRFNFSFFNKYLRFVWKEMNESGDSVGIVSRVAALLIYTQWKSHICWDV